MTLEKLHYKRKIQILIKIIYILDLSGSTMAKIYLLALLGASILSLSGAYNKEEDKAWEGEKN